MELTKIQFEDGQKVSDAYVEINGVKHPVVKAQYQGKTPLSARNLNKMQENVGNAISDLDERVVSYRNVLVDEQALIKECGNFKLKALNKLEGKTEQEVRSGKNLFDKNNVIVGYLEDNNSISSDNNYRTSDYISVKPNTTYYLSKTGSSRGKFYDKNKNPITTGRDFNTTESGTSFTTTSETYYVRFTIHIASISLDTIQLEEGSTATEYEAYGKAPTPNFPSEVKTVTGNVKIGIYNNNLVDWSNYTRKSNNTTYNFENDIATIECTGGTYQKVEWEITDLFLSNAGKTMRFYRDNLETTGDVTYANQIEYIVEGKTKYLYSSSGVFNIPNDVTPVTSASFCIYINNSNTAKQGTLKITKPMLSFSENAEYVEHKSQVKTLSLGDIELYEDEKIYEINDKKYHNKKWKREFITSSTHVTQMTTKNGNSRFVITTENYGSMASVSNSTLNKIYSSIAIAKTGTEVYNETPGIAYNQTKGQLLMYLEETKNMTADEFKAYCEEKGVYVDYMLATPTDTEILNARLIAQLSALEKTTQLYEGITNISITGDNLTPILDIDYWTWFKGESADTDYLQAQIDELRSMIENLNN